MQFLDCKITLSFSNQKIKDRSETLINKGIYEVELKFIASLISHKNKVLVVVHTSTSHGPNYADKYPREFEVFKPVAKNVEEGEKNISLLINAYDNTIRYTDFLLNNLINTLQSMKDWNSAMIFISDHGESLGENKMFMHGLPMRLAPKEQYEIPFLVYISENFRVFKTKKELPMVLEQHFVFHSVLNLLSIDSPAYNKDYDIFVAP